MKRENKHLVPFSGEIIEITVADKSSIVEEWLQNIQSAYSGQLKIVGLDCKFNRHPIRSICGKITTLQVCLDTKCLLLQLLHMHHLPESIKCFLADPVFTFVGMDIHHNITKLCNEYGLACSKMVDIRALAKTSFPISFHVKPSFRALAWELAGLRMRETKKPYKCDWESRIDDKLVEHACIDAYASYRIACRLLQGI